MSSLIVEVSRVDAVERHPNADRMCICTVKGWRVCAGRDPEAGVNQYAPGDRCIYIPPDAVLPPELYDRIGCTKYLAPLNKNADGTRPAGGRVRVARLRGEPSYGLIVPSEDATLSVGIDVADRLGITKWEPPTVQSDGDALPAHALFHHYTEIENYRNFPDLLREDEEVVLTEKIHGKNCRLGFVLDPASGQWTWMAGSHNQRRQEMDTRGRRSQFWEVLTEPVRELLRHIATKDDRVRGIVLFGELFGAGVQDMWYGHENGRYTFRAFDIAVDGKYADFDRKAELLEQFGVEAVPILYRGPFTRSIVETHVSGPTTLCDPTRAGKFAGREGVVITAVQERAGEAGGHLFSRVVLKAISFDYLERKGGTEDH